MIVGQQLNFSQHFSRQLNEIKQKLLLKGDNVSVETHFVNDNITSSNYLKHHYIADFKLLNKKVTEI